MPGDQLVTSIAKDQEAPQRNHFWQLSRRHGNSGQKIALGESLLLEKFSRFVKLYDLRLAPRRHGPQPLPLNGNNYSLNDALQRSIEGDTAKTTAPNGDIIELVSTEYDDVRKCLVLLFHRGSPDAAEPSYRRRAMTDGRRAIVVRHGEKEPDEEQSYSAHLVISASEVTEGTFRSALEEVPGLSISPIRDVIATALLEYKVDLIRGDQRLETHFTFHQSAVKSETLTGALKRGGANFITLAKPAKANFVDGDETFKPEVETMKLRIVGEFNDSNWGDKLTRFLDRAKKEGWFDSSIELSLQNGKRKTVKMDREEAAKEVIFVLAEQIQVSTSLKQCAVSIVPGLIEPMAKVIAGTMSGRGT